MLCSNSRRKANKTSCWMKDVKRSKSRWKTDWKRSIRGLTGARRFSRSSNKKSWIRATSRPTKGSRKPWTPWTLRRERLKRGLRRHTRNAETQLVVLKNHQSPEFLGRQVERGCWKLQPNYLIFLSFPKFFVWQKVVFIHFILVACWVLFFIRKLSSHLPLINQVEIIFACQFGSSRSWNIPLVCSSSLGRRIPCSWVSIFNSDNWFKSGVKLTAHFSFTMIHHVSFKLETGKSAHLFWSNSDRFIIIIGEVPHFPGSQVVFQT